MIQPKSWITKPARKITTAPAKVDPNYGPEIRKAISMAIDRKAVINVAFNNTREPETKKFLDAVL